MTRSALSVALIAIGAQLTINLGWVPFTLQLFVCALLAYILNPKEIITTLLLYVFIGLLGLPIFASQRGGLIMLTQPSFGFVLGFLPFTYLLKKHPLIAYISLYSLGLLYLVFVVKFIYQSEAAIPLLLIQNSLFFLPTDILAILLARTISSKYRKTNV